MSYRVASVCGGALNVVLHEENNPVREGVAVPPPKVEAGMTIEEWMEVKRKIATAAEELS